MPERNCDPDELFYLQDTRTIVGNCFTWWEKDNSGYVCDVREARAWTRAELSLNFRGELPRHFVAWPKTYIDLHVRMHVDHQRVNREQGCAITLGNIKLG